MSAASADQRDMPRIDSVYKKSQGPFMFMMWLFIHRAQNRTLHLLADLADRASAGQSAATAHSLAEALDLVWDVMVTQHQREEDDFFFPWLRERSGAAGAEAFAALEAQHGDLASREARVTELRAQLQAWAGQAPQQGFPAETVAQLAAALADFAAANRAHAVEEEQRLVPLAVAVKEADQKPMAEAMRDRGRASPRANMAFPLFRDAACSNPDDKRVWEDSIPWFVRNVVLPGLGLTADYRRYNELLVPQHSS